MTENKRLKKEQLKRELSKNHGNKLDRIIQLLEAQEEIEDAKKIAEEGMNELERLLSETNMSFKDGSIVKGTIMSMDSKEVLVDMFMVALAENGELIVKLRGFKRVK